MNARDFLLMGGRESARAERTPAASSTLMWGNAGDGTDRERGPQRLTRGQRRRWGAARGTSFASAGVGGVKGGAPAPQQRGGAEGWLIS
jgi:hypothetical protein